jgi:hypothetical protein
MLRTHGGANARKNIYATPSKKISGERSLAGCPEIL